MDRNVLEQAALAHLNRGDLEAALRSYLQILKFDPRDVRIRQKVGDLYARTSRPVDAERIWRDLYEQLVAQAQPRQAVSILKQLVTLKPEDARYHYDLGECYFSSGYPNDARVHYETAMRLDVAATRPIDAARAARRLAELSPTDAAARLKVAELLEAGGDKHGALRVYQEVSEEFRRRGRPDEVGRVAEAALRLAPEDAGLLLDAAAARLDAGDPRRALSHLQAAFPQVGKEPRTLDLLARALEAAGTPEKAQKVLQELARIARDAGDDTMEAQALRRLLRHAEDDAELKARLLAAEARLERRERRLTALQLAQPESEEELRLLVRAEVYQRYGFADRADAALRGGLEARPTARALLAAHAEVLALQGRTAEAIARMEGLLPVAGAEQDAVLERILVLRGGTPPSAAADPGRGPAPPAAGASTAPPASSTAPPASSTAPPPSPSPAESPEARGDRLAATGDVAGALLAWREVLADDPLNDTVLSKIAGLRGRVAPAPTAFAPPSEGTFAEIEPLDPEPLDDLPDEAVDPPGEEALLAARAALLLGDPARALLLAEAAAGLGARVVEAMAHDARGSASRAVDLLREATNDVSEEDPDYPEALFVLASLYARTGKQRAASRLFEELRELAPTFRERDVAAYLHGLANLPGRQ